MVFTFFRLVKQYGASQVAQVVKICLPIQEPQEKWVQSLGQEDPLEKEMATHSRFFFFFFYKFFFYL